MRKIGDRYLMKPTAVVVAALFALWLAFAACYGFIMLHWGWVVPLSFILGGIGNQLGTLWSKPFFANLRERRMRSIVAKMLAARR